MIARDPALLAISDLIISRLREYYRLKFDTTDEQAPAVLNCAYLIGGGPSLFVDFLLEQLSVETVGSYCTGSGMHIYARTVDPNPQPESVAIQQIVDDCQQEFSRLESPAAHIRRLRFRFEFHNSSEVSRDIRKLFFAPILEQFPGAFIYPDIKDYDIQLKIGDWDPHPAGLPTAWEAEYQFDDPVPVETLATTIDRNYGTKLELGILTRMPYKELDGVGCQFSLATRFY